MENEKNNGEKETKFQYFLSVGVFASGEKIVQTNAPDEIVGYGLCEFGKRGVDMHLHKVRQKAKPLLQKVSGAFGGRR